MIVNFTRPSIVIGV